MWNRTTRSTYSTKMDTVFRSTPVGVLVYIRIPACRRCRLAGWRTPPAGPWRNWTTLPAPPGRSYVAIHVPQQQHLGLGVYYGDYSPYSLDVGQFLLWVPVCGQVFEPVGHLLFALPLPSLESQQRLFHTGASPLLNWSLDYIKRLDACRCWPHATQLL